ncbi:MAG: hypothetical protein K2P88_15525 [Chitinophagaceae bacterium]|uniref:hypothetical protein n=1 Tax=unclassified Paraflavitalea TaxID=2798305 RepID=UPI003D326E01|nr:hypothetical protein [Chitinophagaceae bacterium]
MQFDASSLSPWSFGRKAFFRFFFIYIVWLLPPVVFFEFIPGVAYLVQYYYTALEKVNGVLNSWFFHIKPAALTPNGNGDYPEQWMHVCAALLIGVVGMIVWSILDRKRAHYVKLNYWFCLCIRYFLIVTGLGYGIIKLFMLQMPFPNLSQLATPLGDFLPMRFSWMFIGYSGPYQIFSGAAEVAVALLLIFRKTSLLGVIGAFAVFLNVMMLNLSYDIPVKINSIMLTILSLYLLAQEAPRLLAFTFNNLAKPTEVFVFPFETKKAIWAARIWKWIFVLVNIVYGVMGGIEGYQNVQAAKEPKPFQSGVYDVVQQVKEGDTLQVGTVDSVLWRDIIFDKNYSGSINATDSRFRKRYGRAYFSMEFDSTNTYLSLKRTSNDSLPIVKFTFSIKDSTTIELRSYPRPDSLFVRVKRRIKPFPLSEKPFHWVSEQNR